MKTYVSVLAARPKERAAEKTLCSTYVPPALGSEKRFLTGATRERS
jgi:hypothetical protein